MTREDFVFRLVVFLAGLVSVGSLGAGLARQRRKVGERLGQAPADGGRSGVAAPEHHPVFALGSV